jgi:hypothetical protein
MVLIWAGALLLVSGVVFMVAQRLASSDTLEPRSPASGFGLGSNWPGLALFALGAVLLLAGAAF